MRLNIVSSSIGLNGMYVLHVMVELALIKIASLVLNMWYWYSTWTVAYNHICVGNADHYNRRFY